ncbi:MAG: hypothetical protein WCW93_00165 [Candidatus Paceibacterota bacterium]
MELYGSYYILTVLPIWATAILLYFLTMGVLFILRDIFEGLFYNTSYSAVLGDGGILVIPLMAAGILQRGAPLPWWVRGWEYHQIAVCLGLLLGMIWLALDRPKQWGDRYHHLVIAPLICYMGGTLLPVIFTSGTCLEKLATIFLIALWAGLVVYDAKTHRLDQRNYRDIGSYLTMIKNTPIHPR